MNIEFNDSWQFKNCCRSVVRCLILALGLSTQSILLCLNCMNILRPFCACVHARVCALICESVMNCLCVHKKKYIVGENEPPFGESRLRAWA